MLATLVKQPAETLRPAIAFDTASQIAAVLSATVRARSGALGASALAASAVVVAGAVTATLKGGVDGERYAVTVLARDTAGAELESELDVLVMETVWATPDGGAPYLSIEAFIRKFGLKDVIDMTDADGSGRIDRVLLIDALTDAQAIAESYLAGRYALPLTTVPRVVQMAIADLARARLYPRGAPEGVAGLAKAADKLLASIGAGSMSLGLPTIEAPTAPPSDAPVLIAPGRRQYPDGLADY